MRTKQSIKFNYRTAVCALIALHLLIVVPLGYVLNVWADEASTLHTTGFGFLYAFNHALADEKQAPLYFWILSFWREIGGSIFFARLFSIVCSCFAVAFFGSLARRFFTEKAAFLTTAFFALHPYLIWASLEIRVYSLVILLSVGLLKLFDAIYFNKQHNLPVSPSPRLLAFFTSLSVLALYTNYYLGFTLVGCFAALIALRKWRDAANYLLLMLVSGLAFLPLVWSIKTQFAANSSGFQSESSIAEGLRVLWNFLLTFVLPTEIFTPETATGISIFRVWIVRLAIAAAIFLLVKKRRRLNEKTIVFGAVTATIAAFLLAAYFIIGGGYVAVRHAAVIFAPVIFFAALILREVLTSSGAVEKPRKNDSIYGAAVTIIYLIFFTYGIYTLYPNLTKRGDWARIADFIEKNETRNQPVIIFPTFDALALPYYYHGANRVLPDEKFFDFELEAESGSANSLKKQTEFVISKIPPDAPEIWFVTGEKCTIKDSCLPLENFVESHYTIVTEKQFYRETVRLLRKN